ncbi:MAG: hypothetical protein IJV04_08925, partial [Lachnospiraceae bacterium]|nr:hypothetical protein [Lachnospiraceae bacterium]
MTGFKDYDEYMGNVFDCVNKCLFQYLENMKTVYSNGQGGYKNVLYPDLEMASDSTREQIQKFAAYTQESEAASGSAGEDEEEDWGDWDLDGESESEEEEEDESIDDELMGLLSTFGSMSEEEGEELLEQEKVQEQVMKIDMDVTVRIKEIGERADISYQNGLVMPFYELCMKMKFDPFTVFCFACGILSSTQTDYAGVFQIVNENGGLSSPTIECAGKLYYGKNYSITGAYGDMSVCLEQLLPVLDLHVVPSMPFSTAVSPDKRIIDYLFGKDPLKLDENYSRFIRMLTDDKELDPILANDGQLESMKISYNEGVRIFSYFGDEGSGRKFFIKHFCREQNMRAISMNCKKLFIYDFQFVEKALWAITRECILTNSCCVLDELQFREDEKEKFYGYMDLAFSKLVDKGVLVFCISKEELSMREITKEEVTTLEIPTPSNAERIECWKFFAKD